ncbi:hypothetical protein M501DRAFT_1008780 [Patellaria atrata CBS 101060]|uniref:Uncharacterized protein n=1 Tax=Patellaria atrata CBS 101060 TaxID=1346257 RepID=A0A9P4S2J5_9PEZI|nr:hypothetical protein M501DRAFT_1008780 [Patellaria atrata CBS 101060]
MDYQNGYNSPSQQHFFNPNALHAQPFQTPPQPTPSSSPYPDPRARFALQQGQHQYNGAPEGFPMAASNMGGGMINSAGGGVHMMQPGLQQQQQQARAPQFSQNKTISPTHHNSPYAAPPAQPHRDSVPSQQQLLQQQNQNQNQQQQPQQQPQPQVQQQHNSMAAPPPPQSHQHAQYPAMKQLPPQPLSPKSQAREKDRVTLLLNINKELFHEILRLQEQGKAGSVGQQQQQTKDDGNKSPGVNKAASQEYIDCMRRLQANLSYLAAHAERSYKPNPNIPPGPAIMTAPVNFPSLVELYANLQNLFPGWKGQQAKASPGPQSTQGGTWIFLFDGVFGAGPYLTYIGRNKSAFLFF